MPAVAAQAADDTGDDCRRRKCDQVLELVDLGYKRDALVEARPADQPVHAAEAVGREIAGRAKNHNGA